MKWILFVLGVPSGFLVYRLGDKLVQKVKPTSGLVEGLLHATPLVMFCLFVILIDMLF